MPTAPAPPPDPSAEGRVLFENWHGDKAAYLQNPARACQLARDANKKGERLLALEIAECALREGKADDAQRILLLQQKALALAHSAATDLALQTLEEIRATGGESAETFGLLGGVYKSLADGTSTVEDRPRFLRRSQEYYQTGFDLSGGKDAFCGINAAAMAALTGNLELARQLAEQTRAADPQGDDKENYWDRATEAEAALILGRFDEALPLYRRAYVAGKREWGAMTSTYKQCLKLARLLCPERDWEFKKCFPTGKVAIFAGHMMDRSDCAAARFPATAETSVRERIAAWLQKEEIRVSYSSAASGSDLIFLEEAQRLQVETYVVLPFKEEKFIETSVRPGGASWEERFHQVMLGAPAPTIINDDVADDASSAYDFTNRMIAAKAVMRADDLKWEPAALCVWNGLDGHGHGGTADAVRVWARAKIPTQSIDPLSSERARHIQREDVRTAVPYERTQTALPKTVKPTVCAVLHLYFEGYFAMRENQYPGFQQKILGTLANTLANTKYPPVSRYGFGPDYAFVFEMPRAAGMLAIEVLDALASALGEGNGGGFTMTLPRLCLHAGTAQLMVNPILNQYTHEGTSITRAGRIVRQPGLNPGVAYCTEPFAALAALDDVKSFSCNYTGTARYEDGAQDRLFSVRFQQKTRS